MAIKSYRALVKSAKDTDAFWVESAKHDFAFCIHRQLKRLEISNAALAEQLGVTPPYISKVMRGDENLTIESMVKIARAAKGKLHLEITDQTDGLRWFRVISGRKNEFADNADAFRKSKEIKKSITVNPDELISYDAVSNNP